MPQALFGSAGPAVRRRALTGLAAAVSLAWGVSACASSDPTPEPSASSASPTTASSSPAVSSTATTPAASSPAVSSSASEPAPAQRYDTEPKESAGFPDALQPPAEGTDLVLEEVRVGRHEGFDRIVFDHTDGPLPGYRVQYEDQPAEPGSGFPVELDGGAYLTVYVTGLQPGMGGEAEGHTVQEASWVQDSTVFVESKTTGIYEGAASYFVALDERRPFSVTLEKDGSRLVIDVQH